MRVLRVERDGAGMYMGATVEAGVRMSDERAHPHPEEDSGMPEGANEWLRAHGCGGTERARFGFTSVAQLRRWIYQDDWVNRLGKVGCELVEYEVGTCYAGHTQAMFDIRDAVVVSRKPLTSLLTEGNCNEN